MIIKPKGIVLFSSATSIYTFFRNPVLLLISIAALCAGGTNQVNLSAISSSGVALRKGETIITSDDASYLNPPINFLQGQQWRDNFPGTGSYFLRSPGYGLIIMTLNLFFPPAEALFFLKLLQVMLFSVSVGFLFHLLLQLNFSKTTAFYVSVFVAICPMFSGFLYYTLTEGVTPALVIIFLYLAVSGFSSQSQIKLILSAVVLGGLILIRPPMLIFLFSYLFLLPRNSKLVQRMYILIGLWGIALLPFGIWQWRNSQIAGQMADIFPVYHLENNSLFRPAHEALWNFEKSFGQTGVQFHRFTTSLWQSALLGESNLDSLVQHHLSFFPRHVVLLIGRDELNLAYEEYFQVLRGQVYYFENGLPMPPAVPGGEQKVIKRFSHFTTIYRQSYPVHTWLVVPLEVYWQMSAHSNLSLFMFQHTFRGRWWMELLRFAAFAIHLLTFILFPLAVVFLCKRRKLAAIALPVLMYLLYLSVVQRGVEERYTLPVLVPMLAVVVFAIQYVYTAFRQPPKLTHL